jgi:membrane-bound lytic murein transglycosylase MltF
MPHTRPLPGTSGRRLLTALAVLALLAGCGREPAPNGPAAEAGATTAMTATAPTADLPSANGREVAPPTQPPPLPSVLDVAIEPHTGDLDEIVKRRQVRMLVAMDRTHFYMDGGRQKGIVADAIVEFERWLNAELKTPKNLKIQAVVVPIRRDQAFAALNEGRGDVIANYLTETPERRKLASFASAGFTVNEVLVTRSDAPPANTVEQLSGREIYVRPGSSYHESLVELNAKLTQAGLKPVAIRELDPNLDTDEALEMVNAGVIPATVADRYVAALWAKALPQIRIEDAIRLRSDAPLTWAVRKDSPKLLELVGRFQTTHGLGTLWGNMKVKEYFATGEFIRNPGTEQDRARLAEAVKFFREYGEKYSLDWLLVAAQAYQESGLDHSAKSHVGAIGIMQVMPATAKDPRVGIPDVHQLDRNIEAGTKYLRFVIDQYYRDEPMTPVDKGLFALASYNAGPARVAKLRAEAEKIGLDPNVWFHNVEVVAARRIGAETVTYCRNIYKYYLAYKLMDQQGLLRPAPATVASPPAPG